jgi:UDP-N-acetylglucosamine 2-epimerase (non-hydrolysing)
VQGPVNETLAGIDNIYLTQPMSYEPFIWLMQHAYLVLTDSGGIQEEAPSLGKPVLVMRDTTERPEAVEAGTVRLVGADRQEIVQHTQTLIDDTAIYEKMSQAHNPYGDGNACQRVIAFLNESEK